MDNSSSSLSTLYDIIGTFVAVAVISSVLSLFLPEQSVPQPLAQTSQHTQHDNAVMPVAHFSSAVGETLSAIDAEQLSQCKVVSVHPSKAILMLDCSEQQSLAGKRI